MILNSHIAGAPGDTLWAEQLRQYAGPYSYKPKTRFCTEGDKGYISFDWNKQGTNFLGDNQDLNLLTVVLPHHVSYLRLNVLKYSVYLQN